MKTFWKFFVDPAFQNLTKCVLYMVISNYLFLIVLHINQPHILTGLHKFLTDFKWTDVNRIGQKDGGIYFS